MLLTACLAHQSLAQFESPTTPPSKVAAFTSELQARRNPNFTVYDSLIYSGAKPNIGLKAITVTGNGYWAGNDRTKPNEAACRALARQVAARSNYFVINIEHWSLDVRQATPATVQANMQKIIQIVTWMKSERPNLKIGMYAFPPLREYWAVIQNKPGPLADWRRANDFLRPMAAKFDFISPSLYTFYEDQAGWQKYAQANIAEAKRFGKPVIPFLWPRYHNSNAQLKYRFIPGDYWLKQLTTVQSAGANGVILWDWGAFTGPMTNLDTRQAWWIKTTEFMNVAP